MKQNSHKDRGRDSVVGYLGNKRYFKSTASYGLPGHYIPRLFFLFSMGMFCVGNTHYYEKLVRELKVLACEVDALRVDFTTLQADYAFDCKQSEIAKKVAPMCLYESPYPPSKVKCR